MALASIPEVGRRVRARAVGWACLEGFAAAVALLGRGSYFPLKNLGSK